MTTAGTDPADDDPTVDAVDTDDVENADANADTDVENPEDAEDRDDAHLQDVEPGAGCTEIWEHLSENRDD